MRVGILVDNNPFAEVGGGSKYPCLRFYLGTYKLILDILGTKEVSFICMNKATLQKNKDPNNDVGFLLKHGYDVKVLPLDTQEEFDLLISGIMQYRPDWQYELLNRLCKQSSRFIYLDSDHEPETNAMSLYRALKEGVLDLDNIREKLTDVLYTEGTTHGEEWMSLLPNVNTYFIPWILHPFYLENTMSINPYPRRYHAVLMRGPESDRVRSVLSRYTIKDIVPPGLFSRRLVNMDELHSGDIKDSSVFIGTMLTNSGNGNRFRVTSKIMESLYCGSLPTVLDYSGELDIDRYPYRDSIPKYLQILLREKLFDENKITTMMDAITNMSYHSHIVLVSSLYEEVEAYHHPNNWELILRHILA